MAWCAVSVLPLDAKPEENFFEIIKGNDCFAIDSIQIDEAAVIDLDKCIGCGACAAGCDEHAIKMVRRTEEEIAKLDTTCMEGFAKLMSRTTMDTVVAKGLQNRGNKP
jgi:ferredoxin